jgi:hypothetical protein
VTNGAARTKVFCLGLSKTGTTSLGDALESLGYRRLTWSRSFSMPLFHEVRRGNLAAAFAVADQYEALEDLPWPLIYRELHEHYPDAKFILTRRRSPAVWARSIHRQTLGKRRSKFQPYRDMFGHHLFYENPRAFLEGYERHNREVAAYFAAAAPANFLDMCFEAGDGWEKLCGFLGLPAPATPFPHSNARRPSWLKDLYVNLFFSRHKDAAIRATSGELPGYSASSQKAS